MTARELADKVEREYMMSNHYEYDNSGVEKLIEAHDAEIRAECVERAIAWLLKETASVESDLDIEWRYRQKISLTKALKEDPL